MGFIFGVIKKIIKWILYLGIFIGIIVLIPNIPPYSKFTSIKLAPPQPNVGPLALNGALNNAQKAFVDKVLGPEGLQVANGELYASLSSGEIVKLSPGGHATYVTKVGQPCAGLTEEHICGRPLGFEIDEKKNELYVADAYQGIWKVNLKTDKKQLLVSPRVEINGRVPRLFNSLAVAKNGDVYWTDSTSDYSLKDVVISMLADPAGRLFHYNAAKNESKVLLDNLWFSNGIVVSPDNQFVVVAETCKLRLIKYYINGPNKGKSEVFADGLPGTPDNLRALPDGSGVLAAMFVVHDDETPLLVRSMAQTPLLRKFFARLMHLMEMPFLYMNTIYPHYFFEDVAYHIGHVKSVAGFAPPMSGLLQFDWNGKIVASYYNTDKSLGHISDAVVLNSKLYTGAPGLQNYVGVVAAPPQLQKAFTKSKTPEKPTEAPKVQAKPTTPKPAPKQEEIKVQKEAPKVAKPAVQQPKPTTPPKADPPTTTPKPVVTKPAATKPAATKPAPATPPPKPAKQPEPKPTTKQPETKPTTAKPVEVKPTTPKPQTKPTAPPKPAETKQEKPAKPADPPKSGSAKVPHEKVAPKQIPIEEEIPSDTAKPSKETLKVIKKGGPTEIPNPHL